MEVAAAAVLALPRSESGTKQTSRNQRRWQGIGEKNGTRLVVR